MFILSLISLPCFEEINTNNKEEFKFFSSFMQTIISLIHSSQIEIQHIFSSHYERVELNVYGLNTVSHFSIENDHIEEEIDQNLHDIITQTQHNPNNDWCHESLDFNIVKTWKFDGLENLLVWSFLFLQAHNYSNIQIMP